MIRKIEYGSPLWHLPDARIPGVSVAFKNFLASVPFECWVAGGAIRAFIAREQVADVDLFFPPSVTVAQAEQHFVSTRGAQVAYDTPNARKLRLPDGQLVDLVKRDDGTPIQTLNSFDFIVCAAAVDREGNFYHHIDFFEDLDRKEINLHAVTDPVDSMRRLQKYAARGYRAPHDQVVELATCIRQMPHSEFQVSIERMCERFYHPDDV